jgi:site-specific DNA-methyltransferase (adenine-specific)
MKISKRLLTGSVQIGVWLMKVEDMAIKDLVPYAKNAKKHDEKQIKNVVESIKQFGFAQPLVVDKNNVLIIGHCRLIAAKRLKLKTVPVLRMEDLTEDQVKKLRLLDNKLNESDWDFDMLSDELDDLNFDNFDLDWNLPEEEEELTIVEDTPPEPPEEPKSKYGQIYQIGRHRVMCGDSTKTEDVDLLLNGAKIDLVVTDPPYNMAYEGAGNTKDRKAKRIMNDKMPEEEFFKFLLAAYNSYVYAMKDGASIYVFYKEMGHGTFMRAMKESGLTFKQELIWVKDHLVLGGSKYQSIYEPCLMGCKGKSIKIWHGGRKQRSVIETIDFMSEDELRGVIKDMWESLETDIIRENKQRINDLHPTMKPVRLIAKFITNSSDKGMNVLDLFGGSGTTMIAAEQTDRNAYIMELDPRFVDVIVQRWENFTGEKAVLISDGKK